ELRIQVSPMDWFHGYLNDFRRNLQHNDFVGGWGIGKFLFKVSPSGSLELWDRPFDALPVQELSPVLNAGGVWQLSQILRPSTGEPDREKRKIILESAWNSLDLYPFSPLDRVRSAQDQDLGSVLECSGEMPGCSPRGNGRSSALVGG